MPSNSKLTLATYTSFMEYIKIYQGVNMKRLYLIILAILPLALSACGAVAVFVPPIEVGDALGVDNRVISLSLNEKTATASYDIVSSADYIAIGEVSKTFKDTNELDLKGFSVQDFRANVKIDKELILDSLDKALTSSSFPKELKLVDLSVTARLEDEPHGVVSMAVSKPLNLQYSLDAGSCKAGKCKYVSSDSDKGLSFELAESDGALLAKLIKIIKEEGGVSSTNKSYIKVEITVQSEAGLASYKMDITLHSKGTKIRLGG